MKFVIENCPQNIYELLLESSEIITNFVTTGGARVILKKIETYEKEIRKKSFYRITPMENNADIIIEYDSIPSLLRALLYINNVNEITSKQFGQCSFTDFGTMLDMSRNAVMKTSEVCNFIKHLAFMGYNYVGLYLEDIMEIPGEPYFGYQRGRYTAQEIRTMDAYAQKYGMYLKPYVQTLAHLNQITQYEDYKPIIDTADILLVDDDRTYKLIDNILKFVSENFTSDKVNIGMDEAHMLGLGKYLDNNGFTSRTDIMTMHLKKVIDIANKYHLKPEMWSDMFFRILFKGNYYVSEDIEPDFSKIDIPKEVTLTYWDYYSTEHEKYAGMMKYHKMLTDRINFATGAWKWSGIVPDNKNSIAKACIAIDECRKAQITDYVVTLWGDDGAEASEYSILPTLYTCAEKAYLDNMPPESFKCIGGYSFTTFMMIDQATPYMDIDDAKNNLYKLLLYNDPFFGTFDSIIRDDMTSHFKHKAEYYESMKDESKFAYIFATLRELCHVLELKNNLSQRIYIAYCKKDKSYLQLLAKKEIPEIISRIENYYETYKKQWMKENKPFGFEVQTIRIGALILRLKDCQDKLLAFSLDEIEKIEELDGERLPMGIYPDSEPEKINLNVWKKMVTPAVI